MNGSDLSTWHPHSTLFTIRVWRETLGAEPGAVRIQVKHVLSGETRYFWDWGQLVKYLERKLYEMHHIEQLKGENTMSLLGGTWTINGNGHEGQLNITAPDTQGNLTGTVYGQEIFGFWDENSQKITFMRLSNPTDPATFQVFTGYLFQNTGSSSPGNITYTLAGHFEAFQRGGGEAQRSLFGWFAQFKLNL